MNRILPDIPNIKAHWDRRASEIPDYLMVPMSDGNVVRYNPEIQQPAFVNMMNRNMKNLKDMAGGGYPRTDECG